MPAASERDVGATVPVAGVGIGDGAKAWPTALAGSNDESSKTVARINGQTARPFITKPHSVRGFLDL